MSRQHGGLRGAAREARDNVPALDFEAVYRSHADQYDRMVTAEDCDGALGPALAAIAPLPGAAVLEVGAGTGRCPQPGGQ